MKTIHENSVLAYWEGREELIPKRTLLVIAALRKGGTLSDREVMVACGFADMNAVRPRITELIAAGIAQPNGDRICEVTKKRVRLVRLVKRETQTALFDLDDALNPGVAKTLAKGAA